MARPRHFEIWKEKGLLNSKLSRIRGLASQNTPHAKIAHALGIAERTFVTMKQEHAEIKEALAQGNDLTIEELMNKMYELAVGKCEKVKTTTTADTKEYIVTNFGSLDKWLNTQIEATINVLKNK